MLPPSGAVMDYLTCGQCSREFPLHCITSFIHHKTADCPPSLSASSTVTLSLTCYLCAESFVTARGLLLHVQSLHKLQIIAPSSNTLRQQAAFPLSPSTPPAPLQVPGEAKEEEEEDGDSRYDTDFRFGDTRLTISQDRFEEDQGDNYDEMNSANGSMICCNSEECCVTIIPGTHEEPRKCCSAVVPKKRKRHMEDHMSLAANDDTNDAHDEGHEDSRDRPDSEADHEEEEEEEREKRESSHSLYIDLGKDRQKEEAEMSWSEEAEGDSQEPSPSQAWLPRQEEEGGERGRGGDSERSRGQVILPPGYSCSFPLTFSLASQLSSRGQYQQAATPSLTITNMHSRPRPQTGRGYGHTPSHTLAWRELEGGRPHSDTPLGETQDSLSQDPALPDTPESRDGLGEVTLRSETAGWTGSEEDKGGPLQELDNLSRSAGRRRRYPTSKPYKCEQCDHAFNQRIHLKKHMSKHTGVKPFKCEQCDYSTVERSHLKVHIRIHTGEKPFKCTFCEYATAQNSTLKIHLKRHHGGRMFECSVCPKKFTQQQMLVSHALDHQPDSHISDHQPDSHILDHQTDFQSLDHQPEPSQPHSLALDQRPKLS